MHRQKGTKNAPQSIIDEIVRRHQEGTTVKDLAEIYKKSFKTIKNMVYREGRKQRGLEKGKLPGERKRGRKPAVTLQEYKYENKRLKMENTLLRDFLQLAERK
jgi:transposase